MLGHLTIEEDEIFQQKSVVPALLLLLLTLVLLEIVFILLHNSDILRLNKVFIIIVKVTFIFINSAGI